MIYADNAATTKLDADAFNAMKQFLLEDYGNASQPYTFSRTAKKALRESRAIIANCIGAAPDEIYFTSGGTESDNWAIKGFVTYGNRGVTITSQIEHHAILNTCSMIKKFGYPVIYLPVDNKGIISPALLEQAITDDTKLISIMTANNEIGTIEPISELAKIARHHNIVFHTDAVQAIGHIPIDVNLLGVDMLSASGHKFNGPKGVGFLYIKHGTPIYSCINGGTQEFGLRAGTENIASIVAMAIALKNNCNNLSNNTAKLTRIEHRFLQILNNAKIDFLHNGSEQRIPGNINISFHGIHGEMLLHRLDLKGIYISTGSACNSVDTNISHVIRAISVPKDYAKGTIRISFGKENAEEDAIQIAEAIINILNKTGTNIQ